MKILHILLETFFMIGTILMISSIIYHLIKDIKDIVHNKYV